MGEHREKRGFADRVQRASVKFTLAEVQAAGATTTLSKTFGKIPPNAVILATILKRTSQFGNGAAGTYVLNIGDGTTSNNVLSAGDIDGGTSTVLGGTPALVNGGTFTAVITGSANLSTTTAGECEAEIRFIA
jgi:hypothetical protein